MEGGFSHPLFSIFNSACRFPTRLLGLLFARFTAPYKVNGHDCDDGEHSPKQRIVHDQGTPSVT
jgi:hypothetical protein